MWSIDKSGKVKTKNRIEVAQDLSSSAVLYFVHVESRRLDMPVTADHLSQVQYLSYLDQEEPAPVA